MTDAIVYDPHCMNMSLEELGKAFAPLDYPQKDFDFQLMIAIGEYMNGRGVAFPGMGTLAARLHCFKMDVKRGVDRLVKLGFLAVQKVKKKGAKWEHNVYTLAKRFLRKTVDTLAQHFDAAKWKTWVEEKMSARQRRKLVNRLCEQVDLDLEHAGVRDGWWMAMRYAKKHVGETPEEYDQILQEAIAKYRDYEGPNYREIADRPVKAAPVMEKPVEPAAPIQEPAGERVVTSASAASGIVNASIVNAAEPEPVDPEPWLQDWDKPIEPEDGSQWPIAQETVKQETSLEALPANTESVSAVGSNTQPTALPANTVDIQPATNIQSADMENVPKFINGEVDARWKSQQLLAKLNPDMYPAW